MWGAIPGVLYLQCSGKHRRAERVSTLAILYVDRDTDLEETTAEVRASEYNEISFQD